MVRSLGGKELYVILSLSVILLLYEAVVLFDFWLDAWKFLSQIETPGIVNIINSIC